MTVSPQLEPEWKPSVIENGYVNVKALAELTEELAAELDYLADRYIEDQVSTDRLGQKIEKGNDLIEAEKALRPARTDRLEDTEIKAEEHLAEEVSEMASEDETYECQLLLAQGLYMSVLDRIGEMGRIELREPDFYR